MKKLIAALVVCLFAIAVSSTNVSAQSMDNADALLAAVPLSAPYAEKQLWMVREYQGIQQHLSTVRINQCWGITAGHAFISSGYVYDNHVVGTGSNYMNDIGEAAAVDEFHLHPTWEAGNGFWDGDRVDLAVVRFSEPIPGQDVEIGALSLGEQFVYAGFGRPATPDTGLLPFDGQRRAFNVMAHAWGGQAGLISTKYVKSVFWPGEIPLNGVATSGLSGGGGYNSSGKLVSLAVQGINSPNYVSSTYGLRLDLYKDWIESYTNKKDACLPPGSPILQVGKGPLMIPISKINSAAVD